MQNRHLDRRSYFNELATTSGEYYIPYLEAHGAFAPGMKVLEIGCGEGGNLEPFAEHGCEITGVDMAELRIEQARTFFAQDGIAGTFISADAGRLGPEFSGKYDIVLAHDVIEHVPDKAGFLAAAFRFLRPGGYAFFGFPAWYMPFGGHQQICRNKFCSHAPFIHLLPRPLYKGLLKQCGAAQNEIDELMNIRSTRITIERFARLARAAGFRIADRHLWLVNPHYKSKFGLTPRTLCKAIGVVPYLRDVFTTSAFFLLCKPSDNTKK